MSKGHKDDSVGQMYICLLLLKETLGFIEMLFPLHLDINQLLIWII